MYLSSWLKRTFSFTNTNQTPDQSNQNNTQNQQQQEYLGVSEPLIEFIKTFTVDTFKNFTLQEEEEGSGYFDESSVVSVNVRKDLSDWQEQHATLVLSKVKEMSRLRYLLCPRHLMERQFWRIYFKLVKGYVTKYELHAIQVAKLRRMAMENEKLPDKSGYEVEMSEAKQTIDAASPNFE